MMTNEPFPRDIEQRRSSPGVVAETGGGNFRLFSSNRRTIKRACQPAEVHAVSMSSLSFIVVDDGGKHVAKERQVVVGE